MEGKEFGLCFDASRTPDARQKNLQETDQGRKHQAVHSQYQGKRGHRYQQDLALETLDMEISTLREYTEELTIYNDSDFDNSDAGEDVATRSMGTRS